MNPRIHQLEHQLRNLSSQITQASPFESVEIAIGISDAADELQHIRGEEAAKNRRAAEQTESLIP